MYMQPFLQMRPWLFVAFLGVSLTLFNAGKVFGQIIFEESHLKCYRVLKDPKVEKPLVDLFNHQFGPEKQCAVADKASFLCAPTAKCLPGQNCQDGIGAQLDTDFLCYRLKCPNPRRREVRVFDQFTPNGRPMLIGQAQMLCTPARKEQQPCGQSAAPQCGGTCNNQLLTCVPNATGGGCFCQD
jgi:hypothetical protein